ncbi:MULTISPECIES: AsnC family transcriptional regulator [unclassified Pseudomonas]|uniref:Lrp/AsnC family transcriptional regulator n=1 Tax=unclassified Pseudomonas TaxID=196821 RepID=UPI00244D77CB|nr:MULTISPECIES: AsnC family transcriptional regulator [unclassified Pseudomonas]MDH0302514.1 AsnC family transcriptional regulator [Pseudomonas sp. GD04091]MDH1983767.1 AsnC family transcriptional regulator [Pseudomonas sp. GD03689]
MIDKTDEQILQILKQNARTSLAEIARRVHKSRTAVESRINRLLENGKILNFTIELAQEVRSGNQTAFLLLTFRDKKCHEVFPLLKVMPGVVRGYSIFGELDMILEVTYVRFEELMLLKERINALDAVAEIVVNPVLKVWQ